jgi:hypothetical protein
MIFKFSQKKIVLDCFTANPDVIEFAPVNFAIKHIPEWWKDLPGSFINNDGFTSSGTMKYCAGMVDYYKKSITIPMWSEFAVKIYENKNFSWQFADCKSSALSHNLEQQAKNFLNGFGHLKIISPWTFKTKDNLNWIWSHPVYNYDTSSDITYLPGITNFKYQCSTNLNVMISLDKEKTIVIPHGQPMVFMTPMTDKKIEIVRHLVSDKEFIAMQNRNGIVFVNRLKTIIEKKEQFSNCPYTKG